MVAGLLLLEEGTWLFVNQYLLPNILVFHQKVSHLSYDKVSRSFDLLLSNAIFLNWSGGEAIS